MALAPFGAEAARAEAVEIIPIAEVWAGHPVGFHLRTAPPMQYVAYYDAERRMTAAWRKLDEGDWQTKVLPERIGWDSHNYVTMYVDSVGNLHLSGNMHNDPLVYWRTRVPGDPGTLAPAPMIGTLEKRVTYPQFFAGHQDQLIFGYRDGASGSGNQIYNVYDPEAGTWSRLLDTVLVDGEGERNAYLMGPRRGPDGFWHLCWVWRATYECETNHYLSYARSRDLRNWERSDGSALALPITFDTAEVADPVPIRGGIINGNTRIGFDLEDRVVLSYHKYDADGNIQVFNARREAGGWKLYQATDWDFRWDFSGGGSIPFEVRVGGVNVVDGELRQYWSSKQHGGKRWILDPETLRPVRPAPPQPSRHPAGWSEVRGEWPGLGVRWANDAGTSGEADTHFMLRWETLGSNRDRPREKPWPPASTLYLIKARMPGDDSGIE